MRTIRVFLGSSEELACDRLALSAFVSSLNNVYVPRGTRIELVIWEHESIAIAPHTAGKQAEYDDLVRASDLALFLFWRRCGQYTLEELECALAERDRTGSRPVIAVWMRELAPGDEATPELGRLLERIRAGEIDLDPKGYRAIGEVELALLDALAPLGADLPPRRAGDFVYVDDEAVIDLGSAEA